MPQQLESKSNMKIPGYVVSAIEAEHEYQDQKYGVAKEQSFPGYLLLIRKKLEAAETSWLHGPWTGRTSALSHLVQIVALGIKALIVYGVDGCPRPTDDIAPDNQFTTTIKQLNNFESSGVFYSQSNVKSSK